MRPLFKFSILSLDELTASVSNYMSTHFLRSKVTIRNYYWVWRKLDRYMFENDIDIYTPLVGKSFLSQRFGLNQDYRKLSTSNKNFVRSIKILSEYQSTGIVKPSKQEVSFYGEIGTLMQSYINACRLRRLVPDAIDRYERTLYRFFCFLNRIKVDEIQNIKTVHILLYFNNLDAQVKSLIQNAASILKLFFSYLYDNNYTLTNLSLAVPRHNIREQPKLPSYYSKDEIESLLQSIERSSDLGKRDYAIILLAARLGLRASDICSLKFENIIWDKSLMQLDQNKTGKRIELPLLTELGNAIIDYLKLARPKSKETYVFLRAKAPFTRLYSAAITSIVHKHLVHAGINIENRRHGAHALRHSLAGVLLEQRTTLPIISEVLGHGSTESTKYYLRIDSTSLKQCALEVPPVLQKFYTQKGGIFYA
ncbi:site-specific integrase [Parabacteroides faecis]|uniref:Integrase n=1 Tax=Parabacteroides faecis TaxID=1217282 RepID=A0ABR6KU91_9BACT|nr:site-specific integrase [Parabacteroides faecis]MBB4625081.1 integrase [Parabacteroides faecis]